MENLTCETILSQMHGSVNEELLEIQCAVSLLASFCEFINVGMKEINVQEGTEYYTRFTKRIIPDVMQVLENVATSTEEAVDKNVDIFFNKILTMKEAIKEEQQ